MSDSRFARLKSDPRFRRPKKRSTKVVVDERFKSVFDGQKNKRKGTKSGRVDKYGRALSDTYDEDNLRRFYRLENDETTPSALDYARGEVLMESSDEEDDTKLLDENSDTGGYITVGHDPSRPITVEEEEIDLDESRFADLDAQAAQYEKSHPEVPVNEGAKTSRLAIVNLDWDHVRAIHLYKICSSLVSPTAPPLKASSKPDAKKKQRGRASSVAHGHVLSVRVYPSQFGKERMAREDKEGPPSELFKKKAMEEVNEKNIYEVGDANEYDEDALRKYQLERLRYYYAVVTCDTAQAASHIYEELEGTELERSANVFDISFVPEDMTFDDEPRDEATEEGASTNYKAVDFVTDALRHSKVKLTWDEDDPERVQVTRRILSQKEIREEDYKAYLASSSSESEDEDVGKKKDRKSTSRNKLRALLLGGDNELPEGWDRGDSGNNDSDVDMEITFAPGLSVSKNAEDETTLEKYQRKLKEKRKNKKEQAKLKEGKGEEDDVEKDDFFDAASDEEDKSNKSRDKGPIKSASRADELALLVSSGQTSNEPQHFSLKAVMKAEQKGSKGKGKKRKVRDDQSEVQEDFEIDVNDDRFKALHEDHQFAIDPTNPHFKKTKAMQKLLDARSKRQKKTSKYKSDNNAKNESLQTLVDSIKKKSASTEVPSMGKRRKLQ